MVPTLFGRIGGYSNEIISNSNVLIHENNHSVVLVFAKTS